MNETHFEGTKAEFAKLLDVDTVTVQGLVTYLEAAGYATLTGQRKAKSDSGRGRPSSVYKIPLTLTLNFAKEVAEAA